MEEIKRLQNEEETKENIITTLLLAINIIVWSVIIIVAIFFMGILKVNAQAIDYNSGANYIHKIFPTQEFIQFGRGVDFTLNSVSAYDKVNIQWTNYQAGVADIAIVLKLVSGTLASYSCNDIYQMFSVVENGQDTGATYRRKECRITGNEIDLKLYWRTTLEAGANSYMEVQLNKQFSAATVVNAYGVMTVNSIEPATNTDIQDQTNALTQVINENTTNITNAINNSLNFCNEKEKTFTKEVTNRYLDSNGNEQYTGSWFISNYMEIMGNVNYTLNNVSTGPVTNYCLYDNTKTLINCTLQNATTMSFTSPNNAKYIRVSIYQSNTTIIGRECQDRTEAEIEELKVLQSLMHTEPWTDLTPDSEYFDMYEDSEDILATYESVSLDSVDIDIDTNTSNWVWTTLTNFLNTNQYVFGMVITILSIGIGKLILGR